LASVIAAACTAIPLKLMSFIGSSLERAAALSLCSDHGNRRGLKYDRSA